MRYCKIDGCNKTVRAKGFCNAHYLKDYKYGDPLKSFGINRGGLSKHPLRQTYDGMIGRCSNPNNPKYPSYGGRGIQICTRWNGTNGFIKFIEDMGKKPDKSYTLDRIDNDGDYTPDNCRWATKRQQAINKRIYASNTTGYRGVSFNARQQKYSADVWKDHKRLFHKMYETALEAATAYNQAVISIRGKDARINKL